jgi:flotillin
MIVVGVAVSISLIEVVPPGFVLVLSGRNRVVANGQTVGYRIVGAGRTMRLPIVERVDRLDVRPHPIGVSVRGAYCKDNVPLAVDATAIIEIASHEPAVNAAVERFLGRSLAEVDRVASETLEGAMRAVVSRLTPAELRTDTARFAHYLTEEAEDDLARLGIALDSLHIERVSGD